MSNNSLNSIPLQWKQKRLGDLIDYHKGFAFKSKDYQKFGHPIVRVSNFTDRSIDIRSCNRLDLSEIDKYRSVSLRYKDVVIATVGSWPSNPASVVGKTICVPLEADGALLNQNAVRLRAENEIDQGFLFYLLKNRSFQNHVISGAQGSANQASITLETIFSYSFLLPPILEQKAIAQLLNSLDSKVELNRQLNETLEKMARAIFKSWFVDVDPARAKLEGLEPYGMDAETAALFPNSFDDSTFGKIPKGWEIGSLGDIADNPRRGVTPNDIDKNTPYIGLEHMPRKSIALEDWGLAQNVSSNKYLFYEGEILFGKLRPYFHKVGVAVQDGVCSTDILVIVPKYSEWYSFVLAHVSSDEFVQYTDGASTGTKMPRTNWTDMKAYKIVLPPKSIAEHFNKVVESMVEAIQSNIMQSYTLMSIRDALLPKLLSGEIRVKDAEKLIDAHA